MVFPMINKKATGVRLRRIMDERGLSVKDVQEYLGLAGVQSIYHWLNGITVPSVDNLYALKTLLQVPIDEMLCGNMPDVLFRCNYDSDKRMLLYFEKMKEKSVA